MNFGLPVSSTMPIIGIAGEQEAWKTTVVHWFIELPDTEVGITGFLLQREHTMMNA
jgi:hypothetical protein